MLLFELFDSNGEMMEQLRQAALDFITPLLGQDLPFVTVQQVIDALRNDKMGISITRGLVMQILNPDQVKAVDKIEGDRIYLSNPENPPSETSQDDKEKEAEQVTDMAQDQAKKQVQS